MSSKLILPGPSIVTTTVSLWTSAPAPFSTTMSIGMSSLDVSVEYSSRTAKKLERSVLQGLFAAWFSSFYPWTDHVKRLYSLRYCAKYFCSRDFMGWKRLLAFISGSVDEELLLRNEYLVTENRIWRNQFKGCHRTYRRWTKNPGGNWKAPGEKSIGRSCQHRQAGDHFSMAPQAYCPQVWWF